LFENAPNVPFSGNLSGDAAMLLLRESGIKEDVACPCSVSTI